MLLNASPLNSVVLNGSAEVAGTTVDVDRDLSWNVQAALEIDRELVWDVRTATEVDRELVWNVSEFVEVDRDVSWSVAANVDIDRTIVWNVQAGVEVDRELEWNVQAFVEADRELIWDVVAFVDADRELLWNVGAHVGVDRALAWDVQAFVTNDRAVSWDVQTFVDPLDRMIEWNVGGRVSVHRIIKWDVGGPLEIDRAIAWGVNSFIERDRTLAWRVQNAVDPLDREIAWAVREFVENDRSILWDTRAFLKLLRQLLWNVRQEAGRPACGPRVRAPRMGRVITRTIPVPGGAPEVCARQLPPTAPEELECLISTVDIDRDLIWNTRQLTTGDRELIWNVREFVTIDREIVFNTVGCVLDDPIDVIPDWDSMGTEEDLTPVPIYGFVGFDGAKEQPYDDTDFEALIDWLWWNLCPSVDFCDGPEIEGIPVSDVCLRLTERWMLVLLDGIFYYGRVGFTLIQAPLDLWPLPVTCNRISICFDANARPCYAAEFAGEVIEVRRYVGGVPTTFTWSGYGPKLFFNGAIQRNNSLQDVVCYYIRAGVLRARFQRDNFAVEYTFPVLASWDPLVFVAKVDKGRDDTGSYEMVAVVTTSRQLVLVRTAPYPFWPSCETDPVDVAVSFTSGVYTLITVTTEAEPDECSVSTSFTGGLYFSVTVTSDADPDEAEASVSFAGGVYFLVVVASDAPPEDVEAVAIFSGGAYTQVIVNGGTYEDESNVQVAFTGGAYTLA
jgi:hypothetical protein